MEIHLGGIKVSSISENEQNRQFRVLDQTISIHAMLRDRYSKLSLILEILLLACSVIFCATTFAPDDIFTQIGLSPKGVRFILGIASITAFFASLFALRVDWKSKSLRHKDAVQKLNGVLALFRKLRKEDGTWLQERVGELNQAYCEAMNNIVEIPDNQFVRLKSRHLRKVEISKMSSAIPGCPVFLLRFVLFCRYISKVVRKDNSKKQRQE
jgi:hypothetical protein